jgi:hypothetical protein
MGVKGCWTCRGRYSTYGSHAALPSIRSHSIPSEQASEYRECNGLKRTSRAGWLAGLAYILCLQSLERKVRCDAQRPTCGNCAKTRRECQGYGIQLSWPRDGDGKRAVVLRDIDARRRRQRGRDLDPVAVLVRARFVNVRSWDVALAVELENGMAPSKYVLQHSCTVPYCLGVKLDGYTY